MSPINFEPNGPGIVPYLDVMTVNSSQFPTAYSCKSFLSLNRQLTCLEANLFEEHTRLLMEPISIPNLEHTGIETSLVNQRADLFYKNGGKKYNIRASIRSNLKGFYPGIQTVLDRPEWDSGLQTNLNESSTSEAEFNRKASNALMSPQLPGSVIVPSPKTSKRRKKRSKAAPVAASTANGNSVAGSYISGTPSHFSMDRQGARLRNNEVKHLLNDVHTTIKEMEAKVLCK